MSISSRALNVGDIAITEYNLKPWKYKNRFVRVRIIEKRENVYGCQSGTLFVVRCVDDTDRLNPHTSYDADWFEPAP